MFRKSNRLHSPSNQPIGTVPIDDDVEVLPTETVNVSIDSSDDENNDGQESVISNATIVEERQGEQGHFQNDSINPADSVEKLLEELRIKTEDEDIKSYVLPYLKSLVHVDVNNTNNIEIIKEEEMFDESPPTEDDRTSMANDSITAILNNCRECSILASERSGYLQHLKDVHKVKLFECPHCASRYLHEEFLVSHIKETHSQFTELTCSVCHKCVESRAQLGIHLLKDHSFVDAKLTECVNIELVRPNVSQKFTKNDDDTPAENSQKGDDIQNENVYDNNKTGLKRLNSSEKLIVDIISNRQQDEHKRNKLSRNEPEMHNNKGNKVKRKSICEKTSENNASIKTPGNTCDTNESNVNPKDVLENVLINGCDDSEDVIRSKRLLRNMLNYLKLLEKVPVSKQQDTWDASLRSFCNEENQDENTDTIKDKSTEKGPELSDDATSCPRVVSTKKVSKSRRKRELYQCFICDFGVRRECDLVEHTRTEHIDYQSLQCLICKRKFGFFRTLKRHFCFNHDITKIQLDRDFKFIEKVTHDSKKSIRDLVSPTKSKTQENYGKSSESSVILKDVKTPETGVSTDNVAGSVSSTPDTLAQNAEKRFSCGCCNFSTQRRKKLKKHMKDVHKTELLHKCSYCDKLFATTSDLTNHLQTFHRYSESLLCLLCNRKFKYMKILEEHVRDRHGKVAKLQPDVDFKIVEEILNRASRKSNRNQPGKMTYKCRRCNFKNTNKGRMRMHVKAHMRCVVMKRRLRKNKQNNELRKSFTRVGKDKITNTDHTYFSSPQREMDLLKISRKMQRRVSALKTGLHECEKRTVFVAKPFGNCTDATLNQQPLNGENEMIIDNETVIESVEMVPIPLGQDSSTVIECQEDDIYSFNVVTDASKSDSVKPQPSIFMTQKIDTSGRKLQKLDNFDVVDKTSISEMDPREVDTDGIEVDKNTIEETKIILPKKHVKTNVNFLRSKTLKVKGNKRKSNKDPESIGIKQLKSECPKDRESFMNRRQTNDTSLETVTSSLEKAVTRNTETHPVLMALHPITNESRNSVVNAEEVNTQNIENVNKQYFDPPSKLTNRLLLFPNKRSTNKNILRQTACDKHNHIEKAFEDTVEHSDSDSEVTDILLNKPIGGEEGIPGDVSLKKIVHKQCKDVVVISDSPMFVANLNEDNIELFEEQSSSAFNTESGDSEPTSANVPSKRTDNITDGIHKNVALIIDKIKNEENTVDSVNSENDNANNSEDNANETVVQMDSDDDIVFVNTYVENERNVKNIEIVEEETSDTETLQTDKTVLKVENAQANVTLPDANNGDTSTKLNTDNVKNCQFKDLNMQPIVQSKDDNNTQLKAQLYECFQCSSKHANKVDLLTHINKVHSSCCKVIKYIGQPTKGSDNPTKIESTANKSNENPKPCQPKLIRVLSDICLTPVRQKKVQVHEKASEGSYTTNLEELFKQIDSQERVRQNSDVSCGLIKPKLDVVLDNNVARHSSTNIDKEHTVKKKFFCSPCQLHFPTNVEYTSHVRLGHKSKRSVKCGHCQLYHAAKACTTRRSSKNLHSPKGFQMTKHLQSSKDAKSTKDLQSSKDFQLAKDLQSSKDSQSTKKSQSPKDWCCRYCQEKFLTAFDHWEHLMNAHEKEASKDVLKNKNMSVKDVSTNAKSNVEVRSARNHGMCTRKKTLEIKLNTRSWSAKERLKSSKSDIELQGSATTNSMSTRKMSCRKKNNGERRSKQHKPSLGLSDINCSKSVSVSDDLGSQTGVVENESTNQAKEKDAKEEHAEPSLAILEKRQPAHQYKKEGLKIEHPEELPCVVVRRKPANQIERKTPKEKCLEKCSVPLSSQGAARPQTGPRHPPAGPRRRRLYKCGLCRYRSTLKPQLVRHLRSVHERAPHEPPCPFCEYVGAPSELLWHLAEHHARCAPACPVRAFARLRGAVLAGRGMPCPLCPLAFATREGLETHEALVHAGEPVAEPNGCGACGVDFDDEQGLVEHLCEEHQARDVYSCDQCSFTSTVSVYLQDHVRVVHDRLSCPACDLRAPFETSKRDTCICRTFFKSCGPSWPTLAEPVEPDNPDEGPAQRLCSQCGWMFANRAQLEVHKQQHNGVSKT